MRKLAKNIKIIVVFIVLITLVYSTISLANSLQKDDFQLSESYEHEQWENLPEEERRKTIEPYYSTITLKESMKRSTYNTLMSGTASNLGDEYDLREILSTIKVKNQLTTGSCWAFAASSMIETNMTRKYNSNTEYSPMHIDYFTARLFGRTVGEGGTFNMLLAYLANGYGPTYESDLPFSSVYNPLENTSSEYGLKDLQSVVIPQDVRARATDLTMFAGIYKQYDASGNVTYKSSQIGGTTYSENEVLAIRNNVKEHIKNEGAVVASFYTDIQIDREGSYSSQGGYLNPDTGAWYLSSSATMNHAVTIVGWDDTYEVSNFADGHKPAKPGAYIVLNSYGEDFGKNGYIYVSYDDAIIEQQIIGINDIYKTDDADLSEFYTHSELGENLGFSAPSITSVYTANVYDKRSQAGEKEYLNEIGVYLRKTEGIEIYTNTSGSDLNNLTLVATKTGSEALEPGYHTIDITPQELTGNKFVIAVKYIKNDSETGGADFPLECNMTNSGISVSGGNYYNNAESNPGESYISIDGTQWDDLDGFKLSTYTLRDTSACIDAYTDIIAESAIVEPTGVTLNSHAETIKINETKNLIATVQPESATHKDLIWSSSKDSVATVSNGTVKGISEGTAIITVKTVYGNVTDTCVITVESAEPSTGNIPVSSVSLNTQNLTMKVGNTSTLVATLSPINATNKKVSWSSSDSSVVEVSSTGMLTAKKEGTAQITVTTNDGSHTATASVTVIKNEQQKNIAVQSVSLNTQNLTMQVGQNSTLVATLNPTNATNREVSWSSSDSSIVEVSSTGVLTAKREGTAQITVTTNDGSHTATANITVIKKTNSPDDIYTDGTDKGNGDPTKLTGTIPQTGQEVVTTLIIIISFIAISIFVIKFIKYNYK